jgi:hypothetical protein
MFKPPAINLFSKLKSMIMNDSIDTNPDQSSNPPGDADESNRQITARSPGNGKPSQPDYFSAIFNGLGIGLLLGLLWSLSLSPVISGVIATLSSLLAVLIGLNEKYLDSLKSLRIGAFGLFAVVGILLGLYIRGNDPFSPTLTDRKNEYISAGFDESEAKMLIAEFIQSDTTKVQRSANVLYSSKVDVGACDILVYASENAPPEETMNTFVTAGGTWKELAETFKTDLPESILNKALLTMRDCFCGIASSGIIEMTNLDRVRKIKAGDSVSKIEIELSAAGDNWKRIVDLVSERFAQAERKEVYLSIIKVLSHD